MTLPHFGVEHFEVEVAGPSHGGIGTLSRSIGVSRISKMFAPLPPNLATNRQNPAVVAQAPGGARGGATFLPTTWPLLTGPSVFELVRDSSGNIRAVCVTWRSYRNYRVEGDTRAGSDVRVRG
jgi:hypothetical protein